MSTLASARSRLQIEADRRAAEQARRVGSELRQLREDCGLGQGVVARAAGISAAHLCRIEAGQTDASRRALARIAAVLGPDVSERIFPNTGPRIRDRLQAPILESLLTISIQGGAVTSRSGSPAACGALSISSSSMLQTWSWPGRSSRASAAWSSSFGGATRRQERSANRRPVSGAGESAVVSRLLVLRSTASSREIVRAHSEVLRTESPARACDAYTSLTGAASWPGPALIWARLEGGKAVILPEPPRGVGVGR
jgi:transcriptional regulator with XRE-family HTH domain